MDICVHCKQPIEHRSGHWAHYVGPGSYLNRCQSPDVPYGMEAHPASVLCPEYCLGSRS